MRRKSKAATCICCVQMFSLTLDSSVHALMQALIQSSSLFASGIRCSSLHGYKRVAPLYVLCLQVETEKLRSKEETKQVLLDLSICLTRILYLSRSVELVDQCVQELTSTSFSADAQAFLVTILHENLTTTPSSTTPKDNRVCAITGAALGAALDATARESQYQDWCTEILLEESLTNFPVTTYLKLAHGVLERHVSMDVWRETISPALLLKVRSHPDKALETVLGWIQGIPDAILEQDDISDDWMTTVLDKNILAAGAQAEAAVIRKTAALQLLLTWTSKSPAAWSRLAHLLSTKKTTLAPAREACYKLWRDLAIQQMTCPEKEMPNLTEVIGQVIPGILAFLPKETNAEPRLVGREALVEWIVVAKRQQETVGYEKALDFIRSSVPGVATKSTESSLISLLVQMVHPDLLESILVDLWQENSKWTKSIESIAIMAATKKAVHVDGLVVVYLCLLHAVQSGKPIPAFINKILSVGSAVNKADPSFVYSQAMTDSVATNPLLSMVLPRTIALYLQIASVHQEGSSDLFPSGKVSVAARTLAACVLHPNTTHDTASPRTGKDQYPINSIVASLENILMYQPHAAPVLVEAILDTVNATSLGVNEMVFSWNATKEARESETITITTIKGQGSQHAAHRGFDPYTVRRVGRLLAHRCGKQPGELLARVMVLMHVGSSLRSEGHQRAALILNTLNVIREAILPNDGGLEQQAAIADEITRISTQSHFRTANSSEEIEICALIHRAGMSLLQSLGGVAANFSPEIDHPEDEEMKPYVYARKLCLLEIATRLSSRLDSVLKKVEDLSMGDIDVFLSPIGTLCIGQEDQTNAEVKKVTGKRLTEDEEWDQQMKRELAEKKKSSEPSFLLSDEDKRLIAAQDQQREQLSPLLTKEYARSLDSIRYLVSSDIEIGNSCLPECSTSVLKTAVSACPALKVIRSMRAKSYDTLKALASCVYEIDDMHAPTIAHALILSCKKIDKSTRASEGESSRGLEGCALPSPCAPAACVVYEMEKFHNTLSGASFAFLFPVLRACLLGPRTPVGCDAALRVLERHTALLHGEEADGTVSNLRRDLIACVLELLKHDRAQSFHDPTAFETLTACCKVDALSEGSVALTTAEVAPLLDERGALGKRNCRLGSMIALARIAEDHQKLVKSNPLIENRLWLNSFDKDDEIREAAQKAWASANGVALDEGSLPKPSPLYAAPLLPLLSHSDESIANAAADAFANALAIHSGLVGRNIEIICKTYIESVPSPDSDSKGKSSPSLPVPLKTTKPSVAPPVKKKPVPLSGLPKKKAPAKKSALDVAGIGRPKAMKTTKKKSAAHAVLLKPKVERTLDDVELANQFKTVATKQSSEDKDSPSKISVRLGVLHALAAVTRLDTKIEMDEATLNLLTSFLIAYGIADGVERVKNAARDTLRDIVASNGGSDEAIKFLLPHLENVLKTGVANEEALGSLLREKIPKDISASDRRKEGAVVALGSVALHLKGPEYETRVDDTIDMLLTALNTPSEDVQLSVADALSKLMKKGRTQERVEDILNNFLRNCLHGGSLAVRRGAAYGLSAAIKGSGIATLKKYEIVKKLDEACASGNSTEKEGALFAIELLSSRLGLLFEPYVILLLPSLLKSFSDSSDYVRKAASNTVSVIMSKLSAHGVKLVMPATLEAFDDAQWRTKQASIHMLGAMSHLAPKQLASALPKVVPKLTEAFSDTHPKVKASAQEALDEISNVVRNPEISSISGILMKALTDPADCTFKALEVLIETEFLHAIDAPSLALIVPILHRGLRDRGATTKRFAALISANITTMVNDAKEMIPYLPTLLPDLQSALLDPIPDVRSTAAKAMGSLTRSLGDQILPELRPWLVNKLRDPACSSAERSGAAQGLTEVIIVSGTELVDDTMRNEILPLHSHPEPSTREGVLWMLSFLPPALGQNFTSLIDTSLPALIGGLSDDSEPVRDVALRAGRVLIRSHGKHHTDKILPSLEAGLCDEDHRIRVASLSLLGDLLSMIGGTSVVKGEGDTQDDIRRAERAQAQIALALGPDTRRRVFSSLYIARSDSIYQVRQSALQVWKTVVSVTARTLRDILPVLVSRIIDDLASGHDEKTAVAGRSLGDVVSKLGDSVLPQIIPVLRNALSDGNEYTKRGVCVGLTEVINCSTKDQILRFLEIIVKLVQDALSDESPGVRAMAASSFQSLYSIVGSRTFDEVVPSLLVALENGEDETSRTRALNGLVGILSVRSRELLPYIIPRLIQRPFTINHAKALAGIVEVTGSTIYTQFSTVIPAILGELSEPDQDDERKALVRECSKSVSRYVDQAGVNPLVSIIASNCSSDKPALRRESCRMFEDVVTESK